MICFIGCVKNKVNFSTEAQYLYNSSYFKYCLAYAKQLNPDKIYILSTKYGVLELNDIVEPYEATLNTMTALERKEWANRVLLQLKEKNIDFNTKTIFLCGKKYRQYIQHNFPNSYCPFDNLQGGIGVQLNFLKKNVNKE